MHKHWRNLQRKSTLKAAVVSALALITCAPVTAQNAVAPTPGIQVPEMFERQNAWLQQISVELRILRAEVIQLRLEAHEARKAALEQKLEEIRKQQADFRDEQKMYDQQVAELTQIANQALADPERQQIEAVRAEMGGRGMEGLRRKQALLSTAEAETAQHLEQERTLSTNLRSMLQQLLPAQMK